MHLRDWGKIDRITKAMDDVLEYENILTGMYVQGDISAW